MTLRTAGFGAEFQLCYALASEVGRNRIRKRQRTRPVTTMNSVRTVSYFANRQAGLKKSSAVADECQA
jgi:hypothetical protein